MGRALNRCSTYHVSKVVYSDYEMGNQWKTLMTTDYRWYNWKVTRPIKNDQGTAVTSKTCVKTVGYHSAKYNNHTSSVSDTQTLWCLSSYSNKNDNLLSHYHVCQDTLYSPDTMSENIFLPNESVAESWDSFTLTKSQYKFGNLQIYCYESNAAGQPYPVNKKLTISQVSEN